MSELMSNGAHKERRAQIRRDDSGRYSVFTWSDFGGTVGIIQWREFHDVADWSEANRIFCDWFNRGCDNE